MRLERIPGRKVLKLLDYFPVVVLTGVRQCGKTTLAQSLKPDWRYVDLESSSNYELLSNNCELFLRQYPTDVIFDEAQLLPDLFSNLRHAIDENREQKGRYILTGSSSPDLVSNIAESLAGRAATVEIGTLKSSERYCAPPSQIYEAFCSGIFDETMIGTKPKLNQNDFFRHWYAGGYPEPSLSEDTYFRDVWVEQYIGRYLERDVRRLFPGLNINRYRRFLSLLANMSGQILNQSDLAKALEVSSPTIKDYLEIASGTFLWRNLNSYESKASKAVTKMPKGYLRDTGLIHSLLKIPSLEHLQVHPIMGRSFEVFAIEELLRGLHYSDATLYSAHHYRTRAKTEIDLVIDTKFGPVPIEVKYSSKIQPRSVKVLRDFIKEHKSPFGLLINNSETFEPIGNKLYQVPAHGL